jgi:hypothetical protein
MFDELGLEVYETIGSMLVDTAGDKSSRYRGAVMADYLWYTRVDGGELLGGS